jgi:hypothetical protein
VSETRKPTVEEVVQAVTAELADRPARRPIPATETAAAGHQALGLARALQRAFRAEPVGGRLAPAKRLVYWFVASAFDRQAKTVEALIPAIEAMHSELVALRREVAERHQGSGGDTPSPDR